MNNFIELTDLNIDNFVSLLQDNEIKIYEHLQGSCLYFNYTGSEFLLKSKPHAEPIQQNDSASFTYYKTVLTHLISLDERVKKLLPKDWWFRCEYFYDTQPSHIYDRVPLNNLMLTAILKNKKEIADLNELSEYASLLSIEAQPILYQGKLSVNQISEIRYFLSLSEDDVDFLFNEKSFSKFFYDLLDPATENSLLMNQGNFQEKLDKLVIKIKGEQEISLAILNPLYKQQDIKSSDFADVYSILLLDFLEFSQSMDLTRFKSVKKDSETMYIDLVSQLFNKYCAKREEKITTFDFTIPHFFNTEKFDLSLEMITNQQTRTIIEKNNKLAYMFKLLVNSLRIPKKTVLGIFTEATIEIFNKLIKDIRVTIDNILTKEKDLSIINRDLLDFASFFQVTYPKDANDEVYPDLYKELDNSSEIERSKNKKK